MRYAPFKKKLEEQRSYCLEEIAKSREALNEAEDGDDGDIAAAMMRKTFAMSRHEALKQKIRGVDQALLRIQNKKFGTCAECGEDIEQERLMAVPTAIHCVLCAER